MSAEQLFRTGGLRVFDKPSSEGGTLLGFVWVENTLAGQLQRWVLRELMTSAGTSVYVFENWVGAPSNLGAWEQYVQIQLPANCEWGLSYRDGLWPTGGGYYVVAQSTRVLPILQPSGLVIDVPEPTYPRRNAVETRGAAYSNSARPPLTTSAGGALPPQRRGRMNGPPLIGAPPVKPTPQTGVPLLEIHQRVGEGLFQPRGIGGGTFFAEKEEVFFEGKELFLLFSGYEAASAEGTVARWRATPTPEIQEFVDLLKHVETVWTEGQRCEVTGCNYYVGNGETAPPAWFL